MVPVLVLDVTEDEADKILLTLDPLAAMAEADADRVKSLLLLTQRLSDSASEACRRTELKTCRISIAASSCMG